MDAGKLRKNIAAREEGGWVDNLGADIPAAGDIRILTRGWYSHRARERRAELEAERTDEHRKNAYTLAERKLEEERIILHEECVLGWENIDENGEAVAFSKDQSRRYIYEEAYEDLAGIFKLAAMRISSIYESSKADAGKNSPDGSDGDSGKAQRTKTKKT